MCGDAFIVVDIFGDDCIFVVICCHPSSIVFLWKCLNWCCHFCNTCSVVLLLLLKCLQCWCVLWYVYIVVVIYDGTCIGG